MGPHRAGPYRPVRLAQPGASGRSVRPGVWPTVFRTCPGGSLVLSVPLAEGVAGALVVLEQLRIHRASPIQRGASGTCGTQRDRWRRTRTRWRRCSGASVRHSHPWAWPPPRPQAAARPVNPADLTSAIRPYRRSPTHQVHSRTTRPACCRSPTRQVHSSSTRPACLRCFRLRGRRRAWREQCRLPWPSRFDVSTRDLLSQFICAGAGTTIAGRSRPAGDRGSRYRAFAIVMDG